MPSGFKGHSWEGISGRTTPGAASIDDPAFRGFTSRDPLVADLAGAIEARYPGHVVGVNRIVRDPSGRVLTDFDIELTNAIIQVKSGGGKGLGSQLATSEALTVKPVIGYGPTLSPHVVKGIQKQGRLVTTDKDTLLEVVRPD